MAQRSLFELNVRKRIAEKCISILDEECKEDALYEDARKEYVRQLESINKQIAEHPATNNNPAPVIVGLKSAKLFGEVKKG